MRSLLVVAILAVAAVVAVAAEEVEQLEQVEQVEEDLDDQIEDVVDTVPAVPMARSSYQGRTFDEWSRTFWSWMGYDDYDYQEYDYYYPASASQFGYGLPSVGYISPSSGGPASSYSSYVPLQQGHHQQFAHPARDDDYDGDDWSLTDMMFDMAVTIVPIGLLLSALPTGLFTFAIRRRSFDQDNMLMDTLEPTQVTRIVSLLKSDLTDRRCQEELFCELSRIGEYEEASYLQKAFYYVSTLVPDFLAAKYDLARLFRITRSGYCKALQCSSTSILEPPKIVHHPTDTNHISEVTTDTETEALEVSNE